MSRSPHRLRRALVTAARLPALADRRGLRWLLGGRVMPGGPIALLTCRGRRTGRTYTIPVEVLVEDGERGEIAVTPMRGAKADWYRNVLAGGLTRVRLRGVAFQPDWRRLSVEEGRDALDRYRREHPLWGRLIVWGMARSHGRADDTLTAAAKAQPLLVLSTSPLRDPPSRP